MKIFILTALISFSLQGVSYAEIDVIDIMKTNTEMMRSDEEKVLITMELVNKHGKTREREMEYFMRGNQEEMRNSLVRFLSPADIKGTGLLTYEKKLDPDDRWLYLPGLRRERRLASSDQQDSFMGSDFSYEDMTLIFVDEFKYTLLGESVIENESCYMIESVHNTTEGMKNSGYSKQVFYIHKTNFYTVGVDYYNKKSVKFKQMRVGEVTYFEPLQKWRPLKQTMENLKTGHKTNLIFKEYQFVKAVPEDMLSIRELRRI